MVSTALLALESALDIWNHHLKVKYKKKVFNLRKRYNEETNRDQPDHAILDDIEFELQLTTRSFAQEIKGS